MTLKKKLIIGAILLATIPVILSGFLIRQQMETAVYATLHEQAQQQLITIRETKKRQIEAYFQTIRDQVVTFSDDRMVIDAMRDFKRGFDDFRTNVTATPQQLERWKTELSRYYTEDFSIEYVRRNAGRTSEAPTWLEQLDDDSVALQYHYIQANPHPLGQKDALERAQDQSAYSRFHARYHPHIRKFLTTFGYYDIFLVDPESGDIVYSVYKEVDYSTSLREGAYAQTGIGRVFQQIQRATENDTVAIQDFSSYPPSYEDPASFIASPIFDGSERIGILIFQLPIDRINEIMTNAGQWEAVGLGHSGETYLVGPDRTLRNQSRFFIEDRAHYLQAIQASNLPQPTIDLVMSKNTSIGLQSVETHGTQEALLGKTGFAIFPDYRGVPVLSAYSPVHIPGLEWVIMSEIDETEAFLPLTALITNMWIMTGWITGLILVMASGVGWYFARSSIKPLQTLQAFIDHLVCGGNISDRIAVTTQDEIGRLGQTYNALLDRLQNINQQVEETSAGVAKLAHRVMSLVAPMKDTIHKQCNQATTASTAAEEMATTVQAIATNADSAARLATQADTEATKGGEMVTETTTGMARLAHLVAESARSVEVLGQRSDEIGNIIELIDEIADRTNLLALNAAIEAARAGDQGRGFAVVADEVRKLAERTSKATQEITTMIHTMQQETKTAIAVMGNGTAEVQTAVGLATQSGETLARIVASIGQVTDSMTQIAMATKEQSVATTEISGNVGHLADASQENELKISTISTEVTHLIGCASVLEWMAIQDTNSRILEPEGSFARVALKPGFFTKFYEGFFQSNPVIAPMFASTDMTEQHHLLRAGIALLLQYARGDETSSFILDRIIEKHQALPLSPDLFQHWEESLMNAVRSFDSHWNAELEQVWRTTLAQGLGYFRKRL